MASYDVVVAGAGLAGAAAAFYLSAGASVLVLEREGPASGASGAAAGLVHPLMGRRARPAWRADEALAALEACLDEADAGDLWRGPGILRPASDPDQAARFQRAARESPRHARWTEPHEAAALYPGVVSPHGALFVETGGAISVPAFVERLLRAARARGASVRTGARLAAWAEEAGGVRVLLGDGDVVQAGALLLALGDGYAAFDPLRSLHLHRVKGQTARVRLPSAPSDAAGRPHLAGLGYVVHEEDALVVGSTYEHVFEDAAPSRAQTDRLLKQAAAMLPALRHADVLAEQAGIRVTVPGTRLPMVGPLPGHRRTWIFTGLGAKGLLTAPLLAQRLPEWLAAPQAIFPDVRVRTKK